MTTRIWRKCPTCGNGHWLKATSGPIKRLRAINWIVRHKRLWMGRPIRRYDYLDKPNLSAAWKEIAIGLKRAGIYSLCYGTWDMKIDVLVARARVMMGAA